MQVRRLCTAFATALVLAGAAASHAAHDTTVDDIIRMHRAGLSEATIVEFLTSYTVCMDLSSGDLVAMAEAGLDPDGIGAIVDVMAACQRSSTEPAPRVRAFARVFYVNYYYAAPLFFPIHFFFDHHFVGHHFVHGHHGAGHHGFRHHEVAHHAEHGGVVNHGAFAGSDGHHGGPHTRAHHGSGAHTGGGHVGVAHGGSDRAGEAHFGAGHGGRGHAGGGHRGAGHGGGHRGGGHHGGGGHGGGHAGGGHG